MEAQSLAESEEFVKGLWYGNPKQGKTTAAAGLARMGQIVAVDTEGQGWLKGPLRKRKIPVENITRFHATSYEQMEETYWEIQGMLDDGVPLVGCVIDHMTDLEARMIRDASQARIDKEKRKLEPRLKVSEEARADYASLNPFVTERGDYGVWTNQARKLMRMYRDLPMHVVFIAHFRTEMGVRVPSLTEKFRVDLMGSMNMVCGVTTQETSEGLVYTGIFREIKQWFGGDRFDVTKPIVANPSLDRIVAAVRGELDFDTDDEQQAFKRAVTR
jgi:hypothetical protein